MVPPVTAPTSTEGAVVPATDTPPAAATDSSPTDSSPADAAGALLDLPEIERPAGPQGPRRRRLWQWGFPLALLGLFAAIPALVYAGYHVVLDSHDGRLIIATTDPAKPGWEGAVEPTPTAAIGTVNENGELTSVTLLSLTADGVGSVIFVPGDTRAPSQVGGQTLVTAYRAGGVDALQPAVESIMGAGLQEMVIADAAAWEELVGPVGSLTVANPDNVVYGGQTTFPKGSIDIPPAKIGAYLRTRNWAENDTNLLLRQEAFWRAWLAKVGTADSATAVPGETDSGVGRFVRTLATDQIDFEVLPVKTEPLPDAYASVFVPLTDEVEAIMVKAIPFPTASPEGSRPRIRVLDGTGQLAHGVGAAQVLAAAGAEIDAIGNAASFKIPTTQFIISGSDHQSQADQLQAALGVGEVVQSADTSDSVDITVILGADALDRALDPGHRHHRRRRMTSRPPDPDIEPDRDIDMDTHRLMTPDTDVVLSLARLAAQAAASKTDEPTVLLDVGDVLAITNYFVITGGRNARQVRTVAEEVEAQVAADGGPRPLRVEGLDSLRWVLLDYGDFVVHVLLDEARAYYELERLWSDVPRIDWAEVDEAGSAGA